MCYYRMMVAKSIVCGAMAQGGGMAVRAEALGGCALSEEPAELTGARRSSRG